MKPEKRISTSSKEAHNQRKTLRPAIRKRSTTTSTTDKNGSQASSIYKVTNNPEATTNPDTLIDKNRTSYREDNDQTAATATHLHGSITWREKGRLACREKGGQAPHGRAQRAYKTPK